MPIKTTWRVETKNGSSRLIISGEYYQEFEIFAGSDAVWMSRMLRKAMRRVAAGSEFKSKKPSRKRG